MQFAVSIQVRVHADQAKILRRAARLKGMKPATFVRQAAVTAAQQIIEQVKAGKAA